MFQTGGAFNFMPNEELKNLLQKNLETSQESLKILKKINRSRLIGNFFSFIKWLIIIGTAFGAYYYLQPYINQLLDLVKQVQGIQKSLQNVPMPR